MVIGNVGRLMLRGGVTLAAALMMTTAVLGQDQAAGEDPAVTVEVMPFEGDILIWHDVNPADDGIAVDETEPAADGGPDIVIDDGEVIDDWPGDDGWTDEEWVDDGSVDDGWTDEEWVDDGSDGGWVDDGSDGGTGDGTDGAADGGVVDDGEVVIYYLDGGPVRCAECDLGDLPMEAYQSGAGNPEVQRGDEPVAAKPRRSSGTAFAVGSMAACLADHPQLPWICEWQNGAGQ